MEINHFSPTNNFNQRWKMKCVNVFTQVAQLVIRLPFTIRICKFASNKMCSIENRDVIGNPQTPTNNLWTVNCIQMTSTTTEANSIYSIEPSNTTYRYASSCSSFNGSIVQVLPEYFVWKTDSSYLWCTGHQSHSLDTMGKFSHYSKFSKHGFKIQTLWCILDQK